MTYGRNTCSEATSPPGIQQGHSCDATVREVDAKVFVHLSASNHRTVMEYCVPKVLGITSTLIDERVTHQSVEEARCEAFELYNAYVTAGRVLQRCYMWVASLSDGDPWFDRTDIFSGDDEAEAALQSAVHTRRTIREQVERDIWMWDTWSPGLLDQVLLREGAQVIHTHDRVSQFLWLRSIYPLVDGSGIRLVLFARDPERKPIIDRWWWHHFVYHVPATQHYVDAVYKRIQETRRVLRAPRAAHGLLPVNLASTIVCRDSTKVHRPPLERSDKYVRLYFMNTELALVAHATGITLPFMRRLALRDHLVLTLFRRHYEHYTLHRDNKFSYATVGTSALALSHCIVNYWERHYEALQVDTLYEQICAAEDYFRVHVWNLVYIQSPGVQSYMRDWSSALLWATINCYPGQVPPKGVLVLASACWTPWNVKPEHDHLQLAETKEEEED